MEFLIIDNDLDRVEQFVKMGVHRIFVDLEINGKLERQGHLDTVISHHTLEDVRKVKNLTKKSLLHVRVNPWGPDSIGEIEDCVALGADILMLPMFTKKEEVKSFVKAVSGRAKVSLLLETAQAFMRINSILEVKGIDEIHIGLNDLHLSMGLDFMLEIYCSPYLEQLSELIVSHGISLGIGGVAPIGEGAIPGEIILKEAYRLGSERLILSRAFDKSNILSFEKDFKEMLKMSSTLSQISKEELTQNFKNLKNKIDEYLRS